MKLKKTALSLLIRHDIPQVVRDKDFQREGLEMIIHAAHPSEKLSSITDLSHGDIINLRSTLRDAKILGTPSAQLDKDDFKYQCEGTIVVNGNFIHYEIAYDEQNEAYREVV